MHQVEALRDERDERDELARPQDRWLGRTLGERFVLHRCLGRGGMGTVYEAEDLAVRRRVALKVLEPMARLSKERSRRFVREARAAARVDHPNVVSIYDVGPDRITGALFMVLELLQGIDLREHLRARGQLSVAEALSYLLPIAEALEAAHQLGIVHRDVTPANVFLSRQPDPLDASATTVVPKLIDFGLAERIDRPEPGDGAGATIYGTPQYMAPELLRGERVDTRADVWSFGAVLYRCLAGRAPTELIPIDELVDVDADLATTIHRALHPEQDHRFRSMTDLVRALGAHERRRATAEPTPRDVTRARPSTRIATLSWEPVRRAAVRAHPTPPLGVTRTGLPRFGLVTAGREEPQARAVDGLAAALAGHTHVVVYEGYPQLVDALAEGRVEVAWLPPVAYVRAMRARAARLLFTVQRDGHRSYSSALLSPRPLDLAALEGEGARAAWVDPWSAAGYLVPRRMLRNLGVDPTLAFRTQTFAGSYANVVRALSDGSADVGAVQCRVLPDGSLASPWLPEGLHVLAVSHEGIPGDTLCASTALDAESARDAATRCIDALMHPDLQPALTSLLGSERFVAANPSRYDALEAALWEDLAVTE